MPFPLLAFLAPIIASALMWAFTRSPFVLMFAFLGPVVALATMGDSRRRARADSRHQHAAFERDYVAARDAIVLAHDRERTQLNRAVAHSTTLVASEVRDSERWRSEVGEHLIVCIGTGQRSSSVVLEEDPGTRARAHPELDRADHYRARRKRARQDEAVREPAERRNARLMLTLDELRAQASSLNNAPVIVDAQWGVGVCGPRAEAAAVATSIAVQLAATLSPRATELRAVFDSAGTFEWVRDLPHFADDPTVQASQQVIARGSAQLPQLSFRTRGGGAEVRLCVSEDEHSLPHDCRVVISVAGSRAHIVRHPEADFPECFVPDYISDRQARRFADTLKCAASATFAHWDRTLPERVALGELNETQGEETASRKSNTDSCTPRRTSLIATVGVGPSGPVSIDLVAEGPHAIIGGTTGSGKSEVLVTWVLGLAAQYAPTEVNFLLVDFKGGAAFAPVQDLPHTVGVLTDLDPSTARRAILSLQAELRRREQVLADTRVRSIAELPLDIELPRLLIIVDEFAAMTASFAEMHDLFADLAARGRSLGIHLILCTQRPAGTIRDSVLANCTLRVSLRVNNSADSVAVIGNPDACQIPKHVPGRCLLQRGGAATESVQWARADRADAEAIVGRWKGRFTPPRRPWLDPLPALLERGSVPSVPAPAVVFGLTDIPEQQCQSAAIFDPTRDGNLFVVGSHRSGKSTLVSNLASTVVDSVVLPANAESAWDVVTDVLSAVRCGSSPSLVLVDDLDLIVGRFSQEYESFFIERLTSLVREGPRVGTTLVFTSSLPRGRVQAISTLCASTLVLRMRDKQDHVLVGGDSADFCAELPPGGGFWHGHRVQVSFCAQVSPHTVAGSLPLECSPGETLLVVSARPTALRGKLEQLGKVTTLDASRSRHEEIPGLSLDSGMEPKIILGDPDAWLSSAAILGSQRSRCRIVFHDCSLTEFRSIARIREIPPPIDSPFDSVVVLHPDGRMQRALLPDV